MAQKDVGEMKRAAGFQNEFWNRLADAVVDQGGSAEQLYGADSQGLDAAAKVAATAFISNTAAGTVVGSLELAVNHGKSVGEMMAAGSYTWANGNITDANFPHPREGGETVTIDLVRFDKSGDTAQRERQLTTYGELAEMDDMLALGVQNPDLQREFLLVFLGSAWVGPDGDRRVGCLSGPDGHRRCDLTGAHPGRRWSPNCVFAVRRRK